MFMECQVLIDKSTVSCQNKLQVFPNKPIMDVNLLNNLFFLDISSTQSTRVVEYADCIFAEG